MIHYEDFERERLDPIYDIVDQYSLMTKSQRYFINGMIRALKPKKILEVGVFNGGGSSIILNAISDIDGAKLYSVDYSVNSHTHKDKLTGFLVEEKFPALTDKWQMYRGSDISGYIEEIGGDIDMLVLDTVHIHPWETLNFLCVLPFMKTGAYTILHDITLEYFKTIWRHHLACRYLFGHVVSDEKFSPAPDHEGLPSNIGAFRISEDTKRYADNLFESLFIPWSSKVSEKDMADISAIIRKYYSPEQYEFFLKAVKFQNALKNEDNKSQKKSFHDALKIFAKEWQPRLYYSLKKLIKG